MPVKRTAGKSDQAIYAYLSDHKTVEAAKEAVAMIMEIRTAKWASTMTLEETEEVCCHSWKNSLQKVSKRLLQDAGNANPLFDEHLKSLKERYPEENVLDCIHGLSLELRHRFFKDRDAQTRFSSPECLAAFKEVALLGEWFYAFRLETKIYELSQKRVNKMVTVKRENSVVIKDAHALHAKARDCVNKFPARYGDLKMANAGTNTLKDCCYEAFWALCLLTGRRPKEICSPEVTLELVPDKPYQVMVSNLCKKNPFKDQPPRCLPVLARAQLIIDCLSLLRQADFGGKRQTSIHSKPPIGPAIALFGDERLAKYNILRGMYGQLAFLTRDCHRWGTTFVADHFLTLVRGHEANGVIRSQDHYDAITLATMGAQVRLEA